MAHLDKLNISRRIMPTPQPRVRVETQEHRRKKLIANIEEQIELANLALRDKPLELSRKRGHDVVKVRPRLWWKTDPDGTVLTQIRYNKVPLNLGRRGTSIEVDGLKRLPMVYRTVVRAVKAGELDDAIRNAARKSRT
jgi:hypothetical protein